MPYGIGRVFLYLNIITHKNREQQDTVYMAIHILELMLNVKFISFRIYYSPCCQSW